MQESECKVRIEVKAFVRRSMLHGLQLTIELYFEVEEFGNTKVVSQGIWLLYTKILISSSVCVQIVALGKMDRKEKGS